MFITRGEKSISKTLLALFKKQMQRKKKNFMKTSQTCLHFYLGRFFLVFFSYDILSSGLPFLWSYFLNLYWQPIYYFRKIPRNWKFRTLFPVTLCPRTLKNWDFLTKVFISRFYHPETFFPVTFLHRLLNTN